MQGLKTNIILLAFFLSATACTFGSYSPKGAFKGKNLLSMWLSIPQNADFETVVNKAAEVGIDYYRVSLNWTQLEVETTPGQYSISDPGGIISSLVDFHLNKGHKVYITLASPVNITFRDMPEDIYQRDFDDSLVLARFKSLIDYIFLQIYKFPEQIIGFIIGNEVDIYLEKFPQDINNFINFFNRARNFIKRWIPDAEVSFTSTLENVAYDKRKLMSDLYRDSDFISLTYYPINDDYTVKDLSVVSIDFRTICSLYNKAIYFQECGCPSSSYCNSSPEMQSQFLAALFQAYDENYDHIKAISISSLTDTSQEYADLMANIIDNTNENIKNLSEFIRTLGLMTYPGDGTEKPGFEHLKKLSHDRGF